MSRQATDFSQLLKPWPLRHQAAQLQPINRQLRMRLTQQHSSSNRTRSRGGLLGITAASRSHDVAQTRCETKMIPDRSSTLAVHRSRGMDQTRHISPATGGHNKVGVTAQPLGTTRPHGGKPMTIPYRGMGQIRPYFPGCIGTKLMHTERPDTVPTHRILRDLARDHHHPP